MRIRQDERCARTGAHWLAACLAALVLAPAFAQTTPARISAIAFEGGWNLPLWAAQRQGYFEANGVAVTLTYTPSSAFLMDALVAGRNDIGFALIDNLIAHQEGQADAGAPGQRDLVAVLGGDGGFLSVVAAPSIRGFADLEGATLSVDAMNTGAAFVLREIVARNGLGDADVRYERAGGTANRFRDLVAGKHQATLLRTPFEVLAQARGFAVLASASVLGPYQGTAGIVRRDWAAAHEAALVGFLRAYRAGVGFVCDPANRAIAEALLIANLREMTPALAHQSYDLLVAPNGGITRDLALDPAGIRTVLALRSKYGTPPKTLTDPAPYVDGTYLQKALAGR